MPQNPFGVAFAIRPMHRKFCFVKPMGSSGAKETAASMPFHSCFAAPFNITSLHLISISQYLFFMKIANILIWNTPNTITKQTPLPWKLQTSQYEIHSPRAFIQQSLTLNSRLNTSASYPLILLHYPLIPFIFNLLPLSFFNPLHPFILHFFTSTAPFLIF